MEVEVEVEREGGRTLWGARHLQLVDQLRQAGCQSFKLWTLTPLNTIQCPSHAVLASGLLVRLAWQPDPDSRRLLLVRRRSGVTPNGYPWAPTSSATIALHIKVTVGRLQWSGRPSWRFLRIHALGKIGPGVAGPKNMKFPTVTAPIT